MKYKSPKKTNDTKFISVDQEIVQWYVNVSDWPIQIPEIENLERVEDE